jgi:dephospho-CoA kinase
MVLIGVTGGIGSGKTVVCEQFAALGAPVFSADRSAKDIADTDPSAREEIVGLLGPASYTAAGTLDRALVASKVFADPGLLEKLDEILHPRVFRKIDEWKDLLDAPYALVEAALIFESGLDEVLDYTLVVMADEAIRIERTMKRGGLTRDDVLRRMLHQMPNEELKKHGDFFIANEGTVEDLRMKVRFFHTLFSSLTQRKELE